MLDGARVLVTGGTGSFGRAFVRLVLERYSPRKLIVYSRDEYKQSEMAKEFGPDQYKCMRYFLGDVRDHSRLLRAMHGVDYVVHAAALKQIPTAEYNPMECIKTNILGAENVVNAAIDSRVKRVIALSSDKAANPINLYGATKLCADKLLVSANALSGDAGTRFSVVRYGNVVGSRGSVVEVFRSLIREGRRVLPITDRRMTRFWITLEQGVEFVLRCFELMHGGEIFVPKLPSMSIVELARTLLPDCELEITGIRPGEKLHEVMVPSDDARMTLEFDGYYLIQPSFPFWDRHAYEKYNGGRSKSVPEGFEYSSATNSKWLSQDELIALISKQ